VVTEKNKLEQSKLEEALRNISNYVLPVYTIEGNKYVKFENANQIRQFAKEALGVKN